MHEELRGAAGDGVPRDDPANRDDADAAARHRLRQALVSVYTHDARSKFASIELFLDVAEEHLPAGDRAMARQVRRTLGELDRQTRLLRWALDPVKARLEKTSRSDLRTLIDAAVLLGRTEPPEILIDWVGPRHAEDGEFDVSAPALDVLRALDAVTRALAASPDVDEIHIDLRKTSAGRARIAFRAGGARPRFDASGRALLETSRRGLDAHGGRLEVDTSSDEAPKDEAPKDEQPGDEATVVLELPLAS